MKYTQMNKIKTEFYVLLSLIAGLFLIAVTARWLAPNDPYLVNMKNAFIRPCKEFPCGTDDLGRCILSRVLCGATTTLLTALAVVVCVFIIGTGIGMIAGFCGGVTDSVLMKLTSVFQAFPDFILAVAVAGIMGSGLLNGMLSIIAVYWTHYARISRSLVLQIREENYVKSAKICGASTFQIIMRHVLPNIFPSMLTTAALDISGSILYLAGLSFLGLGVKKPSVEWGLMLNEARSYMQLYPWMIIFPGIALLITVILFNLFSDCIRDLLDHRKAVSE